MNILLKQATIVDQRHSANGTKLDVRLENGQISAMAEQLSPGSSEVVEAENLHISIGWMDMRANFRDPGHEHKEDLESGIKAAAAGGFTMVALSPEVTPAADHKGAIEYFLNRSKYSPVEIVPIGAVSKGLRGETLAEMYDMYRAGAAAFGDGKRSLQSSGLLQRALLYSKNIGAPILHFPYDAHLHPNGQMHEGKQSTMLGLKGIPELAETLMVRRDLDLLNYTGGQLHLGPLSSAASVELVHEARQRGLSVSCETTAAHLAFNDTRLADFDSHYKLLPPLREESNRLKMINQLKNGLIQVITSDHSPEDEEHKKLEFGYAAFGTAGIESFFGILLQAVSGEVPLDQLIATFSIHPRQLLGMQLPQIGEGKEANLTIFSPTGHTDFSQKGIRTRAYNFAERNMTLPGKVLGTVHRGRAHWC